MKVIHIKIEAQKRLKRNIMHFQAQLNNRMLIQENRKVYNRARLKQALYRELH